MSLFLDTFSDETGAAPSGWTSRWVTTSVTLTGQSAAPGTMRVAKAAAGGARYVASMDAAGNSSETEICGNFQVSAASTGAAYTGFVLRGQDDGTDGHEIGYAVFLYDSPTANLVRLNKYNYPNSSQALGTDLSFDWDINTWYRIRFRVENSSGNARLRVKIWPDATPEPAAWQIDHTDTGAVGGSVVTAAGFAGAFAFYSSTTPVNHSFSWIGVATAGETAPGMPIMAADAVNYPFNGQDVTLTYSAAAGGTRVEGDYENAVVREGLSTVLNPSTSTPFVTLGMRDVGTVDTEPASDIGWWFFDAKVENVNAKTPTFQVNLDVSGFAKSAMARGWGPMPPPQTGPSWAYRVWFSYDYVTWTRFANTAEVGLGTSNHYITFSHNAAFTSPDVYIAYGPHMRPSQVTTRVAALAGNAKVSMPAGWWDGVSSAGANQFRIASTTAVNDELGRSIPIQPIYGFKISDSSQTNPSGQPKRRALLTSGVHPIEQEAQFSLWGAVDFLLSGTAAANEVLKRFDFWVVPCVNPAGIAGGYWRQDPHAPTKDTNRYWNSSGVVQCIDLVKAKLLMLDRVHVALDFHCIGTRGHSGFFPSYMFVEGGTSLIGNDWEEALVAAMGAMSPAVTPHVDYAVVGAYGYTAGVTPPGSLEGWTRDRLGGVLTMSVESGPFWKLATSDWSAYGEAAARALVTMYDGSASAPAVAAWLATREGYDLFNDNSGNVPGGWTPQWRDTPTVTWVEGAGGTLVGTKATSPAERCGLSLNTLNGEADVEILIKARSPSTTADSNIQGPTIILRGAGAALTESGYRFSLQNSSGTLQAQIAKYSAGTHTGLTGGASSVNFTWTANTYYWLRARVQGNRLKLRVWADGSPEPDAWTIEQTDTSLASGWHGVFVSANFASTSYPTTFDYMSWATMGARAPDPAVLAAVGYALIAEAGGYGFTGRDVTLSSTAASLNKIIADPGHYGYSGWPAELTYSGAREIRADVAGLNPQAIVEMFEYDDTGIGGGQIVLWHDGTTIMDGPITWQGRIYSPMPIVADGFQIQLQGTLPRPTLRISNIGGGVGGYLRTMRDGVGAKVTRRRTLAKYMDAINFPLGNPNADPAAHFPDEIYFIARKASENAIIIELELAVSYDVIGIQLPARQVIASTCTWVYRSAECGYAGPPVQDIEGNPTSDMTKDRCRKTLAACKARFGSSPLNTSAFPASGLISGG